MSCNVIDNQGDKRVTLKAEPGEIRTTALPNANVTLASAGRITSRGQSGTGCREPSIKTMGRKVAPYKKRNMNVILAHGAAGRTSQGREGQGRSPARGLRSRRHVAMGAAAVLGGGRTRGNGQTIALAEETKEGKGGRG